MTPAAARVIATATVLALRKAAAKGPVAAIAIAAAVATAAATVARAEPVLAVVIRLANREFGVGTRRGGLTFDTRERRAYQPPVHRAFFNTGRRIVAVINASLAVGGNIRQNVCTVGRLRGDRRRRVVLRGLRPLLVQLRSGEALGRQRGGRLGLAAQPRQLRLLVLVVCVAGRTPGL